MGKKMPVDFVNCADYTPANLQNIDFEELVKDGQSESADKIADSLPILTKGKVFLHYFRADSKIGYAANQFFGF